VPANHGRILVEALRRSYCHSTTLCRLRHSAHPGREKPLGVTSLCVGSYHGYLSLSAFVAADAFRSLPHHLYGEPAFRTLECNNSIKKKAKAAGLQK